MDVSIIIVNWNTWDCLKDCLNSVYQQTQDIEFEIIVVDNGSTDGSAVKVKEEFGHVCLIENHENRGFAAANNQGLAVAKARYVLLLNSDTIILKNSIQKTIEFADANPDAAVVGCRVLNPDKTLQETCFMFPSLFNLMLSVSYLYKIFPKSKFFGRERMTWWNRSDVRDVDVVTGCFMLLRRESIEEIGILDERFFIYGEETDWCYRFKQAGWKVYFTPDAEIIHLGGASSKQAKPEMILQLRGSILLFLKKHNNSLMYFIACGLVSLFFLIRVPYWVCAGILSRRNHHAYLKTAMIYIQAAFKALAGGQRLCVHR